MYSLILLQALFGKEGKGGGFAVEKCLATVEAMLVNLLLMFSGQLKSTGGWLLYWWTFSNLLLGFINAQ